MVSAECFFLDVGQGSANVIALGDGRAVLIDCGRTPDAVLELLTDYLDVTRIAALILSHNHVDHVGGMPAILARYRRRIDLIALLQDQPANDLAGRKALRSLTDEVAKGFVPRPKRLERSDTAHFIHPADGEADPKGLRIEIVFPDFLQNLDSQTLADQNASSAVLRLQCGTRKIVFPGDASLAVWQTIRASREEPIECDVLAVPHHGGQLVRQQRANESDEDFYRAVRLEFDRVYADCLRTQYAIVSTGTRNRHGHPIPVHLDSLRDAGAHILCTQITDRCHTNVAKLAPAVLQPQNWPGHAGASNSAVACAGTVLVRVGPDEITVDRFDEHRQQVRVKVSGPSGTARCL